MSNSAKSELVEISYTGLNGDLNPTLQNVHSQPIKTNYGSSTSTDTMLTVLKVKKYIKRGTILSSSINLSNSNIGIGTIGLAYGILQSGWAVGIFLFVIAHCVNHLTMYMMMEIAQTMPIATYAIVCNKCKVPILQIVSDYSMVINKLLSCSGYLIIIGDFMKLVITAVFPPEDQPGIGENHLLYDRRFWICVWMFAFILPTTMLRRIDALKYSSFFGLLCFIYLLGIVQFYFWINPTPPNCFENDDCKVWATPHPDSPLGFFKTISLFIYAYGGHPIAFGITTELIDPTMKRLNRIIWNFCSFATFIYSLVAFGGYFTFGQETKINLLLNYPDGDTAVIVSRIGICFGVGFTYPILANVIKNNLASIIYGVGIKNDKYSLKVIINKLLFGATTRKKTKKKEKGLEERDVTMISNAMYYPLVAVVIAIPMTLALITNHLEVIFQFNGATVGAFNQVIFPALIYYFACKNGVIQKENNWMKYAAIVIVCGGCLLVPFMFWKACKSIK